MQKSEPLAPTRIVGRKHAWQHAIKVLTDKVVAAALLVILSPLLLAIGIAIKLQSPGPIIFKQARYGHKYRVFYVLKFRSMRHKSADKSGANQVRREDGRTTSIGRFLRKTSLDELPQLVNVFLGEMSLVGPRPHPLPLDEKYVDQINGYTERYRVKPGITGWAQVNGHRGPVMGLAHMQARVEHDKYYIENWSLLLDAKILLKTLRYGFIHENAY